MRRRSFRELACPRLAFRVALFYCMCTVAGVCQSPQMRSEIPFRLVHDTLIVVSFEVNQQGPFDFIVDTGMATTTVDSSLARKLSLVPQGHALLVAVGGSQAVAKSSIGRLALGSAQVGSQPVLVEDLSGLRKLDGRIQGIVGQDFLSHFNYLLDYRGHFIRVEQHDEIQSDIGEDHVPMELRHGEMTVEAESRSVRSEKLRLILDSGTSSIVLMRDASERLKLPIRENRSELTTAGQVFVHAGAIQHLTVGSVQFHDIRAALSTQSAEQLSDGLLPTGLFRALYVNNRESFVVFNPQIKGRAFQ